MQVKQLATAIALVCAALPSMASSQTGSNAQTAGSPATESLTFSPFDKSSIPLMSRLPRTATAEDKRIFSQLNQDEDQLITCDWKIRGMEEARIAAHRLSIGDLSTYDGQGLELGGIFDALTKPIDTVYYGKIDKTDLWISKYWGKGLFTSFVKLFPGSMKSAMLDGTVPTQIDHEGMGSYINNYKSAYILYRAQPNKDIGFQGIIFLVDANFVKFKELYAATKNYCSTYASTDRISVIGWRRSCIGGTDSVSGVKTSRVTHEQDTMMVVGFGCLQ